MSIKSIYGKLLDWVGLANVPAVLASLAKLKGRTGQIIQIANVAEDGTLAALEAVEKPSGGGVCYVATEYGISADADDNTPALQTLVDMISANGGGIIFFPVGTYNFRRCSQQYDMDGFIIDYAVEMKSNVSIIGENKVNTVFKQTEGLPYALFFRMATADAPLTGCCFSNFSVDAQSTGDENQVYGKAFYAQYLRGITFRDLLIQGTVATGLGVDYLDNVIIDNVYTVNCGRTWTGPQSGSAGIGIGTGGWPDENFVIDKCSCVGSGQYGIFVENQFDLGWGGNVSYTKGAIISNCITRNGLHRGIGIRGGANITVIGCETYANAADGIYIDGKCRNIHIMTNAATGNGGTGILVNPDPVSERIQVKGCTSAENGGPGIRVESASAKLSLVDNYTDDNSIGLSIAGVTLPDCTIHNNVCLDGTESAAAFVGNTDYIDIDTSPVAVGPNRIVLASADLVPNTKLMPDGSETTEDDALTTDYLDVTGMGANIRVTTTGRAVSIRIAQYDADKNSLVTNAAMDGIGEVSPHTQAVAVLEGCAFIRVFYPCIYTGQPAQIESVVVEAAT